MNRIEKKIDGLGRSIDGLDERLERVDESLERLDARLGEVDARLGEVDARLGEVDVRVGQRIDAFETTVSVRFDAVELRLTKVEKAQQRHGVLLEKHSDDIHGLAESVIGLGERMDRGFIDVLARLNDHAAPLEAASRYFASKLGPDPKREKPPRRKKH
jgi:chromosome segregation ATPase